MAPSLNCLGMRLSSLIPRLLTFLDYVVGKCQKPEKRLLRILSLIPRQFGDGTMYLLLAYHSSL